MSLHKLYSKNKTVLFGVSTRDIENSEIDMNTSISRLHSLIIGPGIGRSESSFTSVKVFSLIRQIFVLWWQYKENYVPKSADFLNQSDRNYLIILIKLKIEKVWSAFKSLFVLSLVINNITALFRP